VGACKTFVVLPSFPVLSELVNSHELPVIEDYTLETVDVFAARPGVHPNTVRKWIYLGIIPSIRIGNVVRIDPVEALAALKAYKK